MFPRGRVLNGPANQPTPAGEARSNRRRHPMSEVTQILSAIEQGEAHAAEELLPLV